MSPAPARLRGLGPAALAALLAAGAAGTGWFFWRTPRSAPPDPPEVVLEDDDPALAEALHSAREAVLRAPDSPAAWGTLGRLLRTSDYRAEARVCFDRAEQLEPAEPRWPYLAGESFLPDDPDGAAPPLRRAAEKAEPQDPDNVGPPLRLAQTLLARGEYGPAEGLLGRVLAADPDNAPAHLALAVAAEARDETEAARRHLLRCLASPTTRRKACSRLAALAQRAGDTAEAARYGRRAEATPADQAWPDPYLLEWQGPSAGKARVFRTATDLENAKRYREAAALLTELVARAPDARGYVGLGRNLTRAGDLPGAEDALRTALRLRPDNAQAHYQLAEIHWARAEEARRRGDRDVARPQYTAAADAARAATKANPHDGAAQHLLGMALAQLGRPAEALAALREAVRLSPGQADPLLHLGELLLETGEKAEARRRLEEAARLAGPDDRRPAEALERLQGKKGARAPAPAGAGLRGALPSARTVC
jgi:Flp pilus assembly protein TadD